jgi:hypothetical protein
MSISYRCKRMQLSNKKGSCKPFAKIYANNSQKKLDIARPYRSRSEKSSSTNKGICRQTSKASTSVAKS